MEEAQEKLQEQKQQLLEKEKQTETAKAEAEQKTKSVQGLSRYEEQLHDSGDGTFSERHRFRRATPPPPPTLTVCPPLRELARLQREEMSVEVALEQKRMARHNLLLDCKIQELPVALLSGNLTEINEVQVGPGGPGSAPVFSPTSSSGAGSHLLPKCR